MAEKDTAEKILEAHNDVFSDIMNVYLLLSGRLNDASSSTLFGADSQMVA